MGIVESYKDGADMPVTIIKQEQIKLQDMGKWTSGFTISLYLTSVLPGNETELQTDLAYYYLSDGFEVTDKHLPVYDKRTHSIHQTINTQIKLDEYAHSLDCDHFLGADGCFAAFSFSLSWNSTTMN